MANTDESLIGNRSDKGGDGGAEKLETPEVREKPETPEVRDKLEKKQRGAAQWVVPILLAASLIAAPLVLHSSLPASTEGWVIVGAVAVLSLVAGIIDGAWYRFNGTLIAVGAAAFFLTMLLFYNSGTWIYLIMVVLLTSLGMVIGDYRNVKEYIAEDMEKEGVS